MASAVLLASLFFSGPVAAEDHAPWPVKEKLIGKKDKKSEDVSGIACASPTGFPRTCMVIDDNLQGAQVVIVRDGEITAGQFIPLITNTRKGKPLELDGEGIAYADGSFYVIGSHGHPRDKDHELHPKKDAAEIRARIEASSQLIRVKIDVASDGKLKTAAEIEASGRLREFLGAQADLKPWIDQRLEKNGLTIEGVAIRDKRLFAGMRGPLLDGNQAAIFSVALNSLFGNAAPEAELKTLDLAGRGVRDLVAFDQGFLILAGPAGETEGMTGNYAVYFWDGDGERKKLAELPKFAAKDDKQAKPEALLPLDRSSGKLRILVLFDGPKEGAPRAFEIMSP
jgi:hypothetical protein